VPVRDIDSDDPAHAILLAMARDAEWLLNHPGSHAEPDALRNRYLRLMIDRKLATYSGSIRVLKLLKVFKDHFPAPLLKLLNCELAGRDKLKENWLLRLVRRPRHVQHPLHHLLLINLLGSTAEQFFALPGELKFFGDAPWPCLNPAASHYREECVIDCRVTFRGKDMRPVATFSCDCGFSFARTGPDISSEDRFRVGRMKFFGTVWEDELKRLWRDADISITEIARRLEVDPLTVKRYVVRLRLVASGNRPRIKQLASELLLRPRKTNTASDERRLQKYRDEWLIALRRFGSQGLKKIRVEQPRVYTFLRKYDREWLTSHLPPAPTKRRNSNSVDWVKRDAQLAEAVRSAAERLKIKGTRRRPILISRGAIARAIGKTTLLRQKILKLPLTVAALKEVTETRESYAVRRIRWATLRYQAEDTLPSRWQLILRSNVYRLKDSPEVKSAINNAMHVLGATLHISRDLNAA
jgi:DNA-binding CsgD family transcriptional regulator